MKNFMNYNFDSRILDAISDIVIIIKVNQDDEFVYEFLNKTVLNETNLSEVVIGKRIDEVYAGKKAKFFIEKYKEVCVSKKEVSYQDVYYYQQGKCYSETRLYPILNEKNQCERVFAIVRDVTAVNDVEENLKEVKKDLQENSKKYQSLFYQNTDAIISVDLFGRILDGNPVAEELSGYPLNELKELSLKNLTTTTNKNFMNALFEHAISGETEFSQLSIMNKAGKLIEVIIKVSPLVIDNQIQGIFCILRDMTEILEAKQKLKESEEHLSIITENAQDLITLINEKGEIIYASPSYRFILGFDPKEYIGKLFVYNVDEEDRETVNSAILNSIKNKESFVFPFKQSNAQNDLIWFEASGKAVFDKQDKFKYLVIISRDISLKKDYEDKLQKLAFYDTLTDLPNRRYFNFLLKKYIYQSKNEGNNIGVFILDIDNFKNINDTFGHDMGDQVIAGFGQLISRVVDDIGIAARLGGDEFAVLFPKVKHQEQLIEVANQIIMSLMESSIIENYKVSTSIGMATMNYQLETGSNILKMADQSLYIAKEKGKDRYHLNA